MSNLIPEIRQDVNGKSTTRWVKPQEAAASKSVIPPVSLNSFDQRTKFEKYRNDAIIAFVGTEPTPSSQTNVYRNVSYLAETNRDVLDRVLERMSVDEDEQVCLKKLLSLRQLLDSPEKIARTLNREMEVLALTKRVFLNTDEGKRGKGIRQAMMNMAAIGKGINDDEMFSTDQTKAIALTAIVTGKSRLNGMMWKHYYQNEKEDIDYIAQNIDKVEALAPLLVERKSHDRGWIKSLLESETPSLAGGAL